MRFNPIGVLGSIVGRIENAVELGPDAKEGDLDDPLTTDRSLALWPVHSSSSNGDRHTTWPNDKGPPSPT